MNRLVVAITLTLTPSLAAAGSDRVEANWRKIATDEDRERLRGWRDAWMKAVAEARAGQGRAALTADPALFDPDRAVGGAMPPAGDYHCRTIKLGAQGAGGLDYVAYPWFRCRVDGDGDVASFAKLDGSQRAVGSIFPDSTGRAVFLGTMMLGDERKPMRYGRDKERDMIGVVERVGPRRWRLALPYPRFESLLDIVELVPDSVGTTGGGTTAGVGATAAAGS